MGAPEMAADARLVREAVMETSDLAMVSRIRVEVRGGSMEAAERVALLVLGHAQMASYLEGVSPQTGDYTDHHFEYPQMTRKMGAPPDPWSELGMHYFGRVAFTFEPAVQDGGVKQFSYVTLRQQIAEPVSGGGVGGVGGWVPVDLTDPEGLVGLEVVTDKTFVLDRVRPVTRDSTRDLYHSDLRPELTEGEATAEEILDNIQRLVNVEKLDVSPSQGWWSVVARLASGMYASGKKPTLREAALECYGKCGVEVTHYDTVPKSNDWGPVSDGQKTVLAHEDEGEFTITVMRLDEPSGPKSRVAIRQFTDERHAIIVETYGRQEELEDGAAVDVETELRSARSFIEGVRAHRDAKV